jgi:hypothetical protein
MDEEKSMTESFNPEWEANQIDEQPAPVAAEEPAPAVETPIFAEVVAETAPEPVAEPVAEVVAEPVPDHVVMDGGCATVDCTRAVFSRGLCEAHWMSRRGDSVVE